MAGRRAVFIDRDGVLNRAVVRGGKPYPPALLADVEIMPGAPEAVARLKGAGFLTVMVTNQPDPAKGLQRRSVAEAINDYVARTVDIDVVKVCWCLEGDDCDCYKPKPGMLLEAASEYGIDLAASYIIGDRWRDVGAGKNAGCRTILIDCGYDEAAAVSPDSTAQSIVEGAYMVLVEPTQ